MEITDVFVLEEAVADLESGRLFYEDQQPGLGGYFWRNMRRNMGHPSICPRVATGWEKVNRSPRWTAMAATRHSWSSDLARAVVHWAVGFRPTKISTLEAGSGSLPISARSTRLVA